MFASEINSHVRPAKSSLLPLKRRNSSILTAGLTIGFILVSARKGGTVLFYPLQVLNFYPFSKTKGSAVHHPANRVTEKLFVHAILRLSPALIKSVNRQPVGKPSRIVSEKPLLERVEVNNIRAGTEVVHKVGELKEVLKSQYTGIKALYSVN